MSSCHKKTVRAICNGQNQVKLDPRPLLGWPGHPTSSLLISKPQRESQRPHLPSGLGNRSAITRAPLRPPNWARGLGHAGGLLTLAAGRGVAPGRSALPAQAGKPLATHQLEPVLAPVHEDRAHGDARASVHVVVSVARRGESRAQRWGRRGDVKCRR